MRLSLQVYRPRDVIAENANACPLAPSICSTKMQKIHQGIPENWPNSTVSCLLASPFALSFQRLAPGHLPSFSSLPPPLRPSWPLIHSVFFSCAFLLFSASTLAFSEQQNMVKISRRESVKKAYRHDVVLLAYSSVDPADPFVFLPSSLWRLMSNCQLDSTRSRK